MSLAKTILGMAILITTIFGLSGCASSAPDKAPIDSYVDISRLQGEHQHKQHVILLHGMYRSNVAMRPVETYLNSLGYTTTNISYPSTTYNIETLVENYLAPQIEQFKDQKDITIHFATHSMGGILVRYYLQHNEVSNIGNVVMIAPPNKGTPLAELFADTDWIKSNSGPAKAQLASTEDSWVNQLAAPTFDVGVIAGNKNNNVITAMLLPGKDDGVVSVESTKLETMKDFITIPAKHYRLRNNITVLQQIAHFLRYGLFFHQ